ncbi:Immediate early response 3-interacting protein 1 [Paragonimus heterotremus]|uniref:Immediate early response 3-interacting protein 1 n=1 Tax=Paragonimus heterotremus TaxID=100268 RepID=A0A8J4WMF2_9TREM|nr:Immediate early response 3-interacting protein 1 [Paragonimus heterotremus]
MFGIGSLVEAVILLLNAVCILHEKRFLAKIGWATDDKDFGEPSSVKSQLLNVIHSIRTVMRSENVFSSSNFAVPLIGVNFAVIILKLVLG